MCTTSVSVIVDDVEGVEGFLTSQPLSTIKLLIIVHIYPSDAIT